LQSSLLSQTSSSGNNKAQEDLINSSSTHVTKFGEEPFVLLSMDDETQAEVFEKNSNSNDKQQDEQQDQQPQLSKTKKKDDVKETSSLITASTSMFASLGITSSFANGFSWPKSLVPEQDQRRDNDNLVSPAKDKVDHDMHMQDRQHQQRLQQMKELLNDIQKEEAIIKEKINKDKAMKEARDAPPATANMDMDDATKNEAKNHPEKNHRIVRTGIKERGHRLAVSPK
jgi:hypothetical protein